MSNTMRRAAYAQMFGPTVGDKVRLADTDLVIEVEKDFTNYGEEVKFGGGKVIRDREAAIDGSGSCTPVFMKLQAAGACLDLFNEALCQARIAFTQEAEIHRKGIGSLEHPRNMPGSWSASRGSRSNRWPCPTAHHCGEA